MQLIHNDFFLTKWKWIRANCESRNGKNDDYEHFLDINKCVHLNKIIKQTREVEDTESVIVVGFTNRNMKLKY